MIRTENWPGWYDNWAYSYNTRPATDVAYSVLKFFAMGGTGMNYYMWHGGTNFGRSAGYLITTTYDYDSPLDEFGIPHQPKYDHLKSLHSILNEYEPTLITSNSRPIAEKLGPKQYAYARSGDNKKLIFLCNDDEDTKAVVTYNGKTYSIAAWSVLILGMSYFENG
jgi:beta-galactosidase